MYALLQLFYCLNGQLWEGKGIVFNSHMESMTKILEQDTDTDLHLVLLWSFPIYFIVRVIVKKIYIT